MQNRRLLSTLSMSVLLASATSARTQEDRGTSSMDRTDDSNDRLGGARVAVDLDRVAGVRRPDVEPGFGGALRIGREHDLVLITITPELMGSVHDFPGPEGGRLYTGLLGSRLVVGKLIEGGIFAHAGVGHSDLPEGFAGLALDLGATLDLTLLPMWVLGVHAAYDTLRWTDRDPFDNYRLGAHLVLAP